MRNFHGHVTVSLLEEITNKNSLGCFDTQGSKGGKRRFLKGNLYIHKKSDHTNHTVIRRLMRRVHDPYQQTSGVSFSYKELRSAFGVCQNCRVFPSHERMIFCALIWPIGGLFAQKSKFAVFFHNISTKMCAWFAFTWE